MILKKKSINLLDVIIISAVILAVVYFGYMVQTSFEYEWDWKSIPQYFIIKNSETGNWQINILLQGLITTIKISIWSTIIAIFIGVFFGLFRVSHRLFRRLVSITYISLIRNLPPLIVVFIFYFFVGDQLMRAIGLEEYIYSLSSETLAILSIFTTTPDYFSSFVAAVVTLGIYEGAYVAEIIRAGVEAIDKGQWEASAALGMTRRQQLRYIIFPQSLQVVIPPMGGQFISTIKDSAIVSIIAIPELTFQGMELMSATYMTFEIWITITIMYFILTFACSSLFRFLERKYANKSMG